MNSLAEANRRWPWLNLAVGALVVLLQRTPAVRAVAHAKELVAASRVGEVLRAAATLAALGALHGRAGATTFVRSAPDPVAGTVGTPLQFTFTYIGTPSAPQSFVVSGTLPPGLSYSPAPIAGNVRSGTPVISGTPTTAGTFTIRAQGIGVGGQGTPEAITFVIAGGAATAPTIVTPPTSRTVAAGTSTSFTVVAGGTPAPALQWRLNSNPIPGATSSTLAIANVQAANAGAYTVVATNSAGSVESAAATLTVTGVTGTLPTIAVEPAGFTVAAGATAALSVVAASPVPVTYQWQRNGAPIAGATQATLLLPGIAAEQAGGYRVVVSNGAGPVTSATANVAVGAGVGRLLNLSVRGNLGVGQELIVGFATNGLKNVLIRGIGPTLAGFGVPGVYADPRLELYDGANRIAGNDNWEAGLAPTFAAVGAFALVNASRDAALQSAISGARTAQIGGPNSGVVLVEVYDAGSGTAARLVNVSARNQVGTGDNILIAGFVVDGDVAKTLLIRAVGPALATLFGLEGTLADPRLEIVASADGRKLAENDNWTAAVAGVFGSVGAFTLPANSRDAALLVTLPPGAYSAQVSGVGGGTGEALIEVYEVP